jgi:hypothetical protein
MMGSPTSSPPNTQCLVRALVSTPLEVDALLRTRIGNLQQRGSPTLNDLP